MKKPLKLSKNFLLQFIAVFYLGWIDNFELSVVACYSLQFFVIFKYSSWKRIGSCIFSNLNFFFEKYSSWERIGSCIFSNLLFFFGKYSSRERIGSCKEVQFLGENGDSYYGQKMGEKSFQSNFDKRSTDFVSLLVN